MKEKTAHRGKKWHECLVYFSHKTVIIRMYLSVSLFPHLIKNSLCCNNCCWFFPFASIFFIRRYFCVSVRFLCVRIFFCVLLCAGGSMVFLCVYKFFSSINFMNTQQQLLLELLLLLFGFAGVSSQLMCSACYRSLFFFIQFFVCPCICFCVHRLCAIRAHTLLPALFFLSAKWIWCRLLLYSVNYVAPKRRWLCMF